MAEIPAPDETAKLIEDHADRETAEAVLRAAFAFNQAVSAAKARGMEVSVGSHDPDSKRDITTPQSLYGSLVIVARIKKEYR